MKEFNTSEDMKKDELLENIDKKFEEDLKEIKEKLNSENLSDEFKENLQAKLEEELNKDTSKTKGKVISFPVITRKLAGICVCFVLLFSSCFAFADEIENVIFKLFGDTDKIIQNAIANGNYKEINMEYVENNGVSIKVDYVVVEDNNLYIAFNVLGEEEFDEVYFDDIIINDQKSNIIYTKKGDDKNSTLIADDKRINTKNLLVTYKLTNVSYNLPDLTQINIKVSNTKLIKNNEYTEINGNWNLEIDI